MPNIHGSDTTICIVGGGPAGLVLGYLLARSGINVVVLEKHGDFLRDFRGDTVHPSTLEILDQCGLFQKFSGILRNRIQQAVITVGNDGIQFVSYHGLRPFDFLALVPQWDFLNFLVEEARRFPTFSLKTEHEVIDLIIDEQRVVGVKANTPQGPVEIYASLVVACDGRRSVFRKILNLEVKDLGAPMDALWFRVPRLESDPAGLQAILGAGHIMVMIDRQDYWQIAYVVPKGSDGELRALPITDFRKQVASLAPHIAARCATIKSWDEVKTLVVGVDRLRKWHTQGALIIGDAAHTMSPIGGVGINLAVQDAVASANILARAIHDNRPLTEQILVQIQQRRERPTRWIQRLQVVAQNRIISRTLASSRLAPRIPAFVRFIFRFRCMQRIPARVLGYGFWREKVEVSNFRY